MSAPDHKSKPHPANVTALAGFRGHRKRPGTQQDTMAQATEPLEADADDTLILRYRAGDQTAFATLYARYKGPLYRYFLRQTTPQNAEDCFQESWAKVLHNIEQYNAQGSFQAYLFRIGHNVLMDHFRRNKRFVPEPDFDSIPAEDPMDAEGQLHTERRVSHLYSLIAKLPIAQRSTWLLRQESELSLQEISNLTAASLEAVKSRLRYANEKIRAGMRRYE